MKNILRTFLFGSLVGLFLNFTTAAQSQNFTPIIEFQNGKDRPLAIYFNQDQSCIVKLDFYRSNGGKSTLIKRKVLDIRYIDTHKLSTLLLLEDSSTYAAIWEFHDPSEDQSARRSRDKGIKAYLVKYSELNDATRHLDGDGKVKARTRGYQKIFEANRKGAFGKVIQNNYSESFGVLGKTGSYSFSPMLALAIHIKAKNFVRFHQTLITHKNTHCDTR